MESPNTENSQRTLHILCCWGQVLRSGHPSHPCFSRGEPENELCSPNGQEPCLLIPFSDPQYVHSAWHIKVCLMKQWPRNLHEDRASWVNIKLMCIEHLLCARHCSKMVFMYLFLHLNFKATPSEMGSYQGTEAKRR